MSETCSLSSEVIALIEQISNSGGKQTISLTVEAAIAQNEFILSLWQTFIITHTAVWTGLVTYKKSIPLRYLSIFFIPYTLGMYINGNSLFDAYIGLESLYNDIQLQIYSQKLQNILPSLYNYYSKNRGLGSTRSTIIIITHTGAFFLTAMGVSMHYKDNKTS